MLYQNAVCYFRKLWGGYTSLALALFACVSDADEHLGRPYLPDMAGLRLELELGLQLGSEVIMQKVVASWYWDKTA